MRSLVRPGRAALAAIVAAAVCAGPAVGVAHAGKPAKAKTTTVESSSSTPTIYFSTGRKIA